MKKGKEEYPGVVKTKSGRYVATHVKGSMTFVTTKDTFEEAKAAKQELEKA